MAQKVTVALEDDLDGGPADEHDRGRSGRLHITVMPQGGEPYGCRR